MSIERNAALIQRLFAEYNKGKDNLDACDDLYAPGYVLHQPDAPPDLPAGPAGIKMWVGGGFSELPDMKQSLDDMVVAEDKAAYRFTISGTSSSTGMPVAFEALSIVHIVNGQVAEEWQLFEDATRQVTDSQ